MTDRAAGDVGPHEVLGDVQQRGVGEEPEARRARVHGRVGTYAGLGKADVEVLRQAPPVLLGHRDEPGGERKIGMRGRDRSASVQVRGKVVQDVRVLVQHGLQVRRGVEHVLQDDVAILRQLRGLGGVEKQHVNPLSVVR